MVSDNERRHLFAVLEERLGSEPAATMMELLPAGGGAELATRSDLIVFKAELRGEMAELRGEMRGDLGELKGQIAQLSAHVDGLLPKQIAANVGSMVAMAGLVIAAAKFL